MNESRTSLLSRAAVNSMDLAVRFWPKSSREWGLAVLAEMGQISEPVAALQWAAGGMLLFGRAVVAQFLEWVKLPAGTGLSASSLANNGGPRFPKHSRLATALVLLAALALLLLPSGREATRTVESSWRGFLPSASDQRELDKIAAKAAEEKDARELAFVAVAHPDAKKSVAYADQAVELDPSLTWIYGSRWHFRGADWTSRSKQAEGLRNFDPGNGFGHVVAAFAIGTPLIEKEIQDNRRGLSVKTASEVLDKNAEWKSEMEKGFAAQKYDSYYRRQLELVQEGWKKNPTLSPAVIGISLWEHDIPDALQVESYADLRSKEALAAAATGNIKEAEESLREVRDFGKKMADSSNMLFEKGVGASVTQRGLTGLEKLYAATGQAEKEDKVKAQLAELETEKRSQVESFVTWRRGVEDNFYWKALLVQIAALLCVMLAILVAISLVVLEAGTGLGWKISRAWRWIACRVADYGPALFLLACITLLIGFQPLAKAYEQFRTAEQPGYQGLALFWEALTLSSANFLDYFYEPYHQWVIGTVALVAIGLFVLVRGLKRGKAAVAR